MLMRKVVDERLYLSTAAGGGMLRREIWADENGRIVRYDLAYINPLIFAGDHGRVLGYDSAHGKHHRHCRGRVTAVELTGFGQIEARFPKGMDTAGKGD